MRLTFANAVSLCALFLMVASPSFAQEGTNKSVQGLVKVHEKESISARLFEANRSAGVSPASSTVDEGMRWVDWPTLGRDGEGRACIGRGGKLVEDGVDVGALIGGKQEEFQRGLTDAAYSGDNAAVCARPATADPVAVVVATVREQLPRVSVSVQPPGGEALVGWNVYLMLGRDPVFAPAPTMVSMLSREVQVRFTARATARVDWDEPQVVGAAQPSVQRYPVNAGVRWEDRNVPGVVPIRHRYQDVGQRMITVTDVWDVVVDAAGVGRWNLTVPMEPVAVPLRSIQSQAVVIEQH